MDKIEECINDLQNAMEMLQWCQDNKRPQSMKRWLLDLVIAVNELTKELTKNEIPTTQSPEL